MGITNNWEKADQPLWAHAELHPVIKIMHFKFSWSFLRGSASVMSAWMPYPYPWDLKEMWLVPPLHIQWESQLHSPFRFSGGRLLFLPVPSSSTFLLPLDLFHRGVSSLSRCAVLLLGKHCEVVVPAQASLLSQGPPLQGSAQQTCLQCWLGWGWGGGGVLYCITS